MKIGELAKRTQCAVETIRYWEKEGLLPEPARTEGNYRHYTEAHLERLRFIRNCRTLDMGLDEIRQLLGLWDHPQENCGQVDALIDDHLDHVVTQIETLEALAGQLRELRQHCVEGRDINQCTITEVLTTSTVSVETSHSHLHAGRSHREVMISSAVMSGFPR